MRRRALLTAVTGTIVASAGCLSSGDSEARIASISLKNDRNEAYDVPVAIEEDDEVVFAEEYRLGTESNTAAVLIEDPVEGPGNYQVRVTMDGREMSVNSRDFIQEDETCLAIEFSLLDNGSTDWDTKSMQQC